MEILLNMLNDFFSEMGIATDHVSIVSRAIVILAILLIVIASYLFCRKVIAPMLKHLASKTEATWDDIVFNDRVLDAICHFVPPIILFFFLPIVFSDMSLTLAITEKCCYIYIVVVSLRLAMALISALYKVSCEKRNAENHSLKGIYQMLKLICIAVGIIIIIGIMVDKNPVVILTGLGATAAVISFVFKDTILGLVGGVQLSANDMLKPGDWIEAPKFNANGIVKDVTLTTIKVQNWDMTISTIPPYALITDSFQNWRGMRNSGGRRVKRAINIDMNSVSFCTDDQLKRFTSRGWLDGIDDVEGDMVNMRVFRNYLEIYISNHPLINTDMLHMVRQLQPTPQGLPIELYFFTKPKDWVPYEKVQTAVFEHILAILPEFGLRPFQSPAGSDFQFIANLKQS